MHSLSQTAVILRSASAMKMATAGTVDREVTYEVSVNRSVNRLDTLKVVVENRVWLAVGATSAHKVILQFDWLLGILFVMFVNCITMKFRIIYSAAYIIKYCKEFFTIITIAIIMSPCSNTFFPNFHFCLHF